MVETHRKEPHLRLLQKTLAQEVTTAVHSADELLMAEEASQILFGKGTTDILHKMNEKTLLAVFDGVPRADLAASLLDEPLDITEFLVTHTGIFPTKGEARRSLKENSISINKEKVTETSTLSKNSLLQNQYILVQKGKKTYFLVVVA